MPWRFGFRIGPFRYSERLGRTQAQQRAAAKARAVSSLAGSLRTFYLARPAGALLRACSRA